MPQGRTISSQDYTADTATPSAAPARSHMRSIVYGMLSAVIAFFLFALFVFLASALFLLIAGMDAGTDLSDISSSFTAMIIVLSQGIAIKTDTLVLSIIPLGLSAICISVFRRVLLRRANTLIGNIASIVTWTAIIALVALYIRSSIASPLWAVLLYPTCIALIAYLWSRSKESPEYTWCSTQLKRYLSATTRRTIALGLRTACRILWIYALIGIVTLIMWIALGYQSMLKVFSMTHIGIGSQIMTSIFTLAWLPNLIIWALGWVLGATISIGTLGQFNLWIGQSSHLPPIPIFGVLPEPVSTQIAQRAILLVPIVCVIQLGLYSLYSPREYRLLKKRRTLTSFIDFLYPIGSFITSIIIVIPVVMLLIPASSGALGHKNLAHVGLSIGASMNTFGRPLQWGLMVAWLLALMIALLQAAFTYITDRKHTATDASENTATTDDNDETENSDLGDEDASEIFPIHNHPREDNNE